MTTTTYPIPASGPNWPLIDATRKLIGELPDNSDLDPEVDDLPEDERGWTQGAWRCESGRCLAGWAAVLAGAKFTHDVYDIGELGVDHLMLGGYDMTSAYQVVEVDGETWHVADYAEKALNLTALERFRLFDGDNTLADIDRHLAAMRTDHGVQS